jgi:deoxyribonuclease-4
MRIGAQISTAGGVANAFARADEAGCETMLIFTKSNRQWKASPLTDEDIKAWQEEREKYSQVSPVSVHASYLINIASSKEELWERSYQALKIELERADALDIPTLTFHPGSHTGSGEEAGLQAIARALNRLLDELPDCKTTICLELMAGQGTNLGCTFEHLGYLLDETGRTSRVGVCFDTCHAFSAGYDIRSPEAYQATMSKLDEVIGFDFVKCFHFNDSQFELGTPRDRHAHIGEGYVGKEGFAHFLNDPRWENHAAHLETPKTEERDGEEVEMDPINLDVLRSLRN